MADYTTDTLNKVGGQQITDFSMGIPAKRDALNAKADASTADYLSRYRQAIMGQEGLPHMYTRIGDELNIPNLRTSAVNLQNQMTNLPETYSKATRGFDVNENQLNRIVVTKSAALAPAVTTATNSYQSAQDMQQQMIAANQAEQQKQLTPFADEKSFLADKYARESTGFTADNQRVLDSLIAKMQSGVALSNEEQANINRLAVAEKSYQAAVKVAEINAAADKYKVDALNTWS